MRPSSRVRRPASIPLLIVIVAVSSGASAQNLCEGNQYQRALCAYRGGDFATAEKLFRAIADSGTAEPETLKSRYFLGRTLMKQKKWDEAADHFIRIYSLSRSFYDEWNCDFLLGECRRALGKE